MVVRLRIKKPLALRERDVTRQITDFLRSEGFSVIRMNTGLFQRPGAASRIMVGTKGQPDFLCLRAPKLSMRLSPWVWGFWLEIKRKDGKLSPAQVLWHEQAHKDGFQVIVADELEAFMKWYRGTGYAGMEARFQKENK